jgi:hypothetical protein
MVNDEKLAFRGELFESIKSRLEKRLNCHIETIPPNPFLAAPEPLLRYELTFNDEKDLMMFVLRYM